MMVTLALNELMSFPITTCACVKSYLKLIETGRKYYSERMRRALRFGGLASVILVSDGKHAQWDLNVPDVFELNF